MCTNSPVTKSFPTHRNDLHSAVLLYAIREVERECTYTSILHSQNVFKVSHPINPICVCFVEWSQGAQAALLSDEIKLEDMFLDCT